MVKVPERETPAQPSENDELEATPQTFLRIILSYK